MSGFALMARHLRDTGDSAMWPDKQAGSGCFPADISAFREDFMSRTRQMLCVFYALVALTALVMTWSQNLQYSGGALGPPMQYLLDLKATPAARSFTVDIGLFLLAGTALMVVEARRLGVRLVWIYVLLGFVIAISVTFPLFLIARERRLAKFETVPAETRLTTSDVIGLAIVTIVVLAMCWFILF
jgi:hypothetical protein